MTASKGHGEGEGAAEVRASSKSQPQGEGVEAWRGRLKPCPFCGGEAELERDSDHHGSWFNLGCANHFGRSDKPCPAGRLWYTSTPEDEAEAIAAWNRRDSEARLAGEAERLQALVTSSEQQRYRVCSELLARAQAAEARALALEQQRDGLASSLRDFLENPLFQVGVGGNPNAVEAMLAKARSSLQPTASAPGIEPEQTIETGEG